MNFSLRITAIFFGLNLDIFEFSFFSATLKACSVCSMGRIAMVDSAFEKA